YGRSSHQGDPEGYPQARPQRRRPRHGGPDRPVRRLAGGARALRGRPAARGCGPRRGRGLCRAARPLRCRPRVRGPPHHMNRKARQELIGIGALAIGLFLGLTLLRLPITGSWGAQIGSRLWRVLGVGSVLLPVLGIGWALAAFERLGSLSAARAAALGAGLILLLPYGIGTVAGADFPAAYAAWSPTQKLVGYVPAMLAHGVHQAVGTAGGTLVGLFALSALGILTVGWHPLVGLRTQEMAGIKARGKAGEGGRAKEQQPEVKKPEAPVRLAPSPQVRKPRPTPPARPAVVPAGVLIPPIDLLHPAPPEDGDAGLAQIEQMGQKLIET